ncbi:MAG: pentapeptide repeat-containing protein [Mucilaginibacter polytrichastri]|nr:pentapeptide repeat-containing protein [Mucilaginibacter polytrichastri]
MKYVSDQVFDRQNYTENALPLAEYERCTFRDCIFSGATLSGIVFSECTFERCNFSSAVIARTSFRSAMFTKCKMLGLQFDACEPFLFSISAEDCQLDLASFYQRKLRKMTFKNCSLKEADFSEADLSAAVFDNCDLADATFDQTVLEKTDFSKAFHYIINPEKNNVKKAVFAVEGLPGLLTNFDIVIR